MYRSVLALALAAPPAGEGAEAESLLVKASTTYRKVLAGTDPRVAASARSLQALQEQHPD